MSRNSSFEYNSVLSNSATNNRQQNGDAHSSNGINNLSPGYNGYSRSEFTRYRHGANMNGRHSTPIRNVRNGHYRRRPFRYINQVRERSVDQELASRPRYEHEVYHHDIWRTTPFNPRTYFNKSMLEDPWRDLRIAMQIREEARNVSGALGGREVESVDVVENGNEEIDVSGALDESEDESVNVVQDVNEEIDVSGALDESNDESDAIVNGSDDGNNGVGDDVVPSSDDTGEEYNKESVEKNIQNEIINSIDDQVADGTINENDSSCDEIVDENEIINGAVVSTKDRIDNSENDRTEEGDHNKLEIETNEQQIGQ